jgi:spermidine synthase
MCSVIAPPGSRRAAQARGLGDLQYYNGAMHRASLALPNFVRALAG